MQNDTSANFRGRLPRPWIDNMSSGHSILICMLCKTTNAITDFVNKASRDACIWGGQEWKLPPLPSSMGGAGGARIALQTELCLSFLSYKGAFSGILNSLVEENVSIVMRTIY